ncbi:hypothetical protein F2P44_16200 [Massilia sp. CCM 8695]|uniref:Uncharacterized protein n=1 Tax=Massilia frigida TaxID=2609281 RepID=A0ABX0N8X8_9BURK|nr:hypothetical protein [Massilia frigida]NHZ80803.1 hypothetical protein [Massilia frigida]
MTLCSRASAFDRIPASADLRGYPRAAQGQPRKAVFCCHVSVAEKHRVYPTRAKQRLVAVDIAFGPLVINGEASGCDLRPSDPLIGQAQPACGSSCGTP